MRIFAAVSVLLLSLSASACSDDAGDSTKAVVAARGDTRDAARERAGDILALTYNVAGLPEGLSQSMPSRFTPIIGPLLNGYDLVFLQESWQTPDPNPLDPLRGYHEILVAASNLPYKTPPAMQPLGNDPFRPSAQLGDGLNIFSRIELGDTQRVVWSTCVESASDCLALKGFSMTTAQFGDGLPVHLYDLHMEAGETPEDEDARDGDIAQLVAYIAEHSQGKAVIVGGDFNLHTDREPAISQLKRLLEQAQLSDACSELSCEHPGSIDKILYRSGERVALEATRWAYQDEVFVSDSGEPLSDHLPVAVRLEWSEKPAN